MRGQGARERGADDGSGAVSGGDEGFAVREAAVSRAFLDLNDRLFGLLREASRVGRPVSGAELNEVGIFRSDAAFVEALVEVYQLRVRVVSRSLC